VRVANTADISGPLRPPGEDARVRCDVDGPVATITLNWPDRRNAQTPVTWAALRTIGSELPGDVRVVVVRGEGASFSAGLDRAMFTPEGLPGVPTFVDVAHAPAAEAERIVEGFQKAFSWLGRPDIVSVAAVQGHAIGAGFQLALNCDLRVAAEDAQFTMAETSLGLVPDLGGTRILRELVGYSRALEICATGRQIAAAEAARIGLVNLVVPQGDLDRAVDELVAALLRPPRDGVVEIKALLLSAAQRSPAEQLLAERQAQLRRIRHLAGIGE
jgi:enoyl-CoA hydratase/carnithine racemase